MNTSNKITEISILSGLTDREILSALSTVVKVERSLNSEIEKRALADPNWPAQITVAASAIYAGYNKQPAQPRDGKVVDVKITKYKGADRRITQEEIDAFE